MVAHIRLLIVSVPALIATGLVFSASSPGPDDIVNKIIFSHALHVGESEIECESCHASINDSQSAIDRNYPDMDVCGDCHDVEDDETCGQCHRDPEEPAAVIDRVRDIVFSHQNHLQRETTCGLCHEGIESSETAADENWPVMAVCSDCHNDERAPSRCGLCHTEPIDVHDIHPADWRHQHGRLASGDPALCAGCHPQASFCVDCHRGDNLDGAIHSLNYEFTHGLDAQSKAYDCTHCHDRRGFCNACHTAGRRMPLNHSALAWRSDHGAAARSDVEACASCHDTDDPTCARIGCHRDSDGALGTDPRIHSANLGRFDSEGPWHDDDGYVCFQCHQNTRRAGTGFCGYCHGEGN